ncbi:MAG TPA: DUF445 family protein [Clostridiales bacterium]|nr:DUF445 family protein [Clostridiales bacterium]
MILACVGAAIGWITNVLAIKFIFRPLQPIQIPILNIRIQGLIPKRQAELAKSIGQIVESELISMEEILYSFTVDESKQSILLGIKEKIKDIVERKLPFFIPASLKKLIYEYIEDILEEEAEQGFEEFAKKMMTQMKESQKIAQMIEQKINGFQLDKLESLVLLVAKKELKHIEILGGVLGFFIGLAQGLIVLV